jgi:hypothetical protein
MALIQLRGALTISNIVVVRIDGSIARTSSSTPLPMLISVWAEKEFDDIGHEQADE